MDVSQNVRHAADSTGHFAYTLPTFVQFVAAISFAPLLATVAMASACALLSIFVIARRWAFIGEGISHSGFGGAGVAWLAMLAAPTLMDRPWVPYAAVVIFCLATALAIGAISRGERVAGDAAIGIFLVASLALGFLAREVYQYVRGRDPVDFAELLFGRTSGAIDPAMVGVVVMISAAVMLTLAALGKEIVSYCFDPQMAQASGVRAALVHYLLMLLIALTIIIGMPAIGAPMVTALLVLPGVTASLLSRRLSRVLAISVAAALVAAVAGVTINAMCRFLPLGPVIVLVLFGEFLLAYAWSMVGRRAA
jgi:ABC-type Mn2+/Zn2+ transport system permease subunit